MHKTLLTLIIIIIAVSTFGEDSLPPLKNGNPAQNVKELYAEFDSTKEPLEAKVIQEWQDDGATIQYITYTIGTFKGKKSTMAGYYAFPADTKGKIPALIQMHGGGQRAMVESAKYGADNGYACLSINWGGHKLDTAKDGDPNTDWGALDATQTGHNSHYAKITPDPLTIDTVESPRNSNWYLIILAAKRGITFLQSQPIVDSKKIGAFGHSMGGKLTAMITGSDPRIKAAVPSCGGSGMPPASVLSRPNSGESGCDSSLAEKTINDTEYLKLVKVPMLYVAPHNDFAGKLDNMYANWSVLDSKNANYSITPHMNHRSIPEHGFANMLFFDAHLKGTFNFPQTPIIKADIKTKDGIPTITVSPDDIDMVAKVDVYYSIDNHILTRFWRTAESTRHGNKWTAQCPIMSNDQYLFIMANVYYKYEHKIVGYRWSSKQPETFGISSEMIVISPEDLKNAKVKAEFKRDRMIEASFDTFQDWYRLDWDNPVWWSAYTRKIKDPMYQGPDGAKLTLDVKTTTDQYICFELQQNSWGAYPGVKAGSYYSIAEIKGSVDWQTVSLSVSDFKPVNDSSKDSLNNWQNITELGVRGRVVLNQAGRKIELPEGDHTDKRTLWAVPRAFRNLRWEGGTYTRSIKTADGETRLSDEEFKQQFQKNIDDSIEIEKREEKKK